MAFQVSPGVLVQERDLTRIIPAVSTSIGAFAGQFSKGPLDEVVSISSEQKQYARSNSSHLTNLNHRFGNKNCFLDGLIQNVFPIVLSVM